MRSLRLWHRTAFILPMHFYNILYCFGWVFFLPWYCDLVVPWFAFTHFILNGILYIFFTPGQYIFFIWIVEMLSAASCPFLFPTFFPLPFCFVGKLHNHSIIFVPWLPDDIPNVDGGILSYKVFVILVHVIIYWYECNVICIFIFVFSLV